MDKPKFQISEHSEKSNDASAVNAAYAANAFFRDAYSLNANKSKTLRIGEGAPDVKTRFLNFQDNGSQYLLEPVKRNRDEDWLPEDVKQEVDKLSTPDREYLNKLEEALFSGDVQTFSKMIIDAKNAKQAVDGGLLAVTDVKVKPVFKDVLEAVGYSYEEGPGGISIMSLKKHHLLDETPEQAQVMDKVAVLYCLSIHTDPKSPSNPYGQYVNITFRRPDDNMKDAFIDRQYFYGIDPESFAAGDVALSSTGTFGRWNAVAGDRSSMKNMIRDDFELSKREQAERNSDKRRQLKNADAPDSDQNDPYDDSPSQSPGSLVDSLQPAAPASIRPSPHSSSRRPPN